MRQEAPFSGEAKPPARAAQYVRMSTDHQQYSTENQIEQIAAYAAQRSFTIVRTYAERGRVVSTLAGGRLFKASSMT